MRHPRDMRISPVPLVVLLLAVAVPASAGQRVGLAAPRFNVVGDAIEIVLTNTSDEPTEVAGVWYIGRARTDETVATYRWPESERRLEPGGSLTWTWDQTQGCFGACTEPSAGERVAPGPYVVAIGSVRRSLQIGQFFRVGFDHLSQDETFTVFVNRASDIEQMTAEAAAEDKTLMVTGIVRKERRYNRPWNLTMGPGSVVLAEVSIEVCDADPYYVQDHRKQWLGDRWCPWSSYVAAVGR